MSTIHLCGECKATLTGSDLGYDGSPAITTNGDHHWCGACWRADLDRRRAEDAAENAREAQTLGREFLDGDTASENGQE